MASSLAVVSPPATTTRTTTMTRTTAESKGLAVPHAPHAQRPKGTERTMHHTGHSETTMHHDDDDDDDVWTTSFQTLHRASYKPAIFHPSLVGFRQNESEDDGPLLPMVELSSSRTATTTRAPGPTPSKETDPLYLHHDGRNPEAVPERQDAWVTTAAPSHDRPGVAPPRRVSLETAKAPTARDGAKREWAGQDRDTYGKKKDATGRVAAGDEVGDNDDDEEETEEEELHQPPPRPSSAGRLLDPDNDLATEERGASPRRGSPNTTVGASKGGKKKGEDDDLEGQHLRAPSTQSDGMPKPAFPGMGLMLMVIASAFSCAFGICIKLLAGIGTAKNYGITTFQVVFIRSFTTALFSMAILKATKVGFVGPWIKNKGATRDLIVRAVAGFMSVSTSTWTQTVLPLGESTVLSFLAPIFTGILAAIFLKETYEKLDILAGTIAMCGVILVARPPFLFPSAPQNTDGPVLSDPESDVPTTEDPTSRDSPSRTVLGVPLRLIATIMAIGAAFLAAVVSVQVRKMGRSIPALQIVMFYNASSTILCILVSVAARKAWAMPSDALSWSLVFAITTMGFLQQWAFTKAMTIEKASKASSMGYVQVILAFIADYVVFGNVPDKLALIGAACVGISVLTIGIVKWKQGK